MTASRSEDLAAPPLVGARRLSALDSVRVRIAMAVDLGLIKPGDRLPDISAVAAALDVSEITVRRGLVSLTDDGVLTRRRGRDGGTYVAANPTRHAVPETSAYSAAAERIHLLIDQRLVVEAGNAALAARAPDDAHLRALDQIVRRMDAVDTWAEFHCLDEEFHLAVAASTGLPGAVAQLRGLLHELYRFYLPYPLDHLRKTNAEHRALVDALRTGDTAGAVAVTHEHVACLHHTMFVGLTDLDT